jgi:hypothetical protein
MSALDIAADVAVDAYDWAVDTLRRLVGLPPLPPQLLKFEFDQQPTVRIATGLQTEMRRTFHAFLRIEQDRNILFEGAPPRRHGRVVVTPLTAALIHVRLQQEARDPTVRHGSIVTEAIFEPLPNGPPLQVDIPSKVLFGNPLAYSWQAPMAERVRLAAIEDGDLDERTGPSSGQTLFHPTRPGRLVLQLTAENGWGQTTVKRTVDIILPKPRITLLSPAVQTGLPNQKARVEWRAEGAREVWFVAPTRGLNKQVTGEHVLETTFCIEPEEFHLIARALHGTEEHRVTLRLLPSPFACLDVPH